MNSIINFIQRHSTWIMLGLSALLLLSPCLAEIKTFLLIVTVESIALGLSGISMFVYTKVDFTKELTGSNLGLIFLGVHLCVGLVVLGVYIAQFGS